MDYPALRAFPGDTTAAKREKRRIADGLLRLRAGLDAHFDAASAISGVSPATRGLRIATWNVRELATRNKYGRRLPDAYWYIAEIVSRFDVVALQEVRGDLDALRRVLSHLGDGWDFLATDVTEGAPGNGERMVFVFDRRRVAFGGVAGELTLKDGAELLDADGLELSSADPLTLRFDRRRDLRLPPGTATRERDGRLETAQAVYLELPEGTQLELPPGSRLRVPAGTPLYRVGRSGLRLARTTRYLAPPGHRLQLPRPARADGVMQFARTPYYVAFQVGWLKLILSTVHIYYGEESARSAGMQRRIDEIDRLTELLRQRANDERDSDSASLFLVLGDFNIVGKEHGTMTALQRRGFVIPDAIQQIPAGTNVERTKFYDQIAYYARPGHAEAIPRVQPLRAGVFDFFEHVYRMGGDEKELTKEMRREGGRGWEYATWRTYQMSDHLPMWVELESEFAEEVLRGER
ncbi:MAG: endonuclease/exonuclease/phosphatase family protein [Sandaracinaceae bacterium]